jgi:hypothetical protein
MESPFFNNDFDSILNVNVISSLYPELNEPHKMILLKYLKQLVLVISMVYDFDSNQNVFMYELTQNDYQDLKWLLSHLLPHLESEKSLKSFENMYNQKNIDSNINNSNINNSSPKYKYSNLQYGRCIRGEILKEIEFNEEHIENNFKLLVSSIIESSHKLYVNWMDVLPISMQNYKNFKLFNNTLNIFKKKQLQEFDQNNLSYSPENVKRLHSIQISDIYNIFRNYLYEDIIPLKLLIYDLVDIRNGSLIPALLFLKHFLDDGMNDILNDTLWSSITDENKTLFEQKLNKLYQHGISEIELSVNYIIDGDNMSYVLSALSIQRLVKALAITFDNNYRLQPSVIRSGYKPISKKIEEDNVIDDEKVYDDYSVENLTIQIESIKPQFMYEHLRKLVQKLKFTFYGSVLFDIKKEKIEDGLIFSDINTKRYTVLRQVTLKNIYNFAKSLSKYQKGKEYISYPKHWKSLENKEKEEILKRLNGNYANSEDWFNIKRYIRYILKSLNRDGDAKLVDVYNVELYTFITDHAFIEIIFQTMITKGILSQLRPNKQLTDKSITSRSDRRGIVSKMNPKIFSMELDNPYASAYSYLTELPYIYSGNIPEANKSAWFSLYALDWVSQIGFVHKYINQRVTYMTGATGVGKSTQVPKLYMYYLKAIDYNSMGKVVCTQPRKAPTKNNADQVSKELGVAIFNNNIDSDYYYVQMHHKTQQHIAQVTHLSLKYITDGTLVQEFKNASPLLKKLLDDKGTMANTNLYDIIIIDEAHEHGKNMDVLLTLMRDFAYYNPSIKLVILSATMDDDEPVYRRYYRDINDNQKFPIDCRIRDNKLDRVNIDRRYHISPVGLGTTHKIEETYLDGSNVVDIVKSLVREGLKGDILIFQPGEADIIKLVEELNDATPDDVIALPFYSALSDNKRTFIETIDENFSKLHISKRESFSSARDLSSGGYNYKNCIICATNIAEASITIRRLYYVIETGTRKALMYSYTKRGGKLVTMNISESSRLQRKGRVGRTGPGHVYYTYKKGLMENNKILFEFSTGNISDSIFSSVQTNTEENLITIEGLLKNKIIKDQFYNLFSTANGNYNYQGNLTHYDYDYDEKYVPQLFETGYDSDNLYDATGMYYIVHPEELYIERDLMGRIKSTSKNDVIYDNNTNKIVSLKMDSFFEDLLMKKYLEKNSNKYFKTQFGKVISEINQTFGFEDPALNEILTFSLFFNTTDDICRIVSILAALNGNPMELFNSMEKNVYDLKSFKSMFKNHSSEFNVLNDLGKEIIKYILLSLDMTAIDSNIRKRYNISENDYNSMLKSYENIETEEDGTRMKLKRETIFSARLQMILFDNKLSSAIYNISNILNINSRFVLTFLELYFVSSDLVGSLYFPNKRNKTYSNEIKKYEGQYKNLLSSKFNPILLTLIHAQPFNIAKRILHTNHFLSVYAPSTENIYSLGVYKQLQKKGITFDPMLLISPEYATSYIFYFNINIQRESVVCIAHITKDYLKLFENIYNYDRLNKVSNNDFKKVDKYIDKLNDKLIPKNITMNDIKMLQYVGTTYKELLVDFSTI